MSMALSWWKMRTTRVNVLTARAIHKGLLSLDRKKPVPDKRLLLQRKATLRPEGNLSRSH